MTFVLAVLVGAATSVAVHRWYLRARIEQVEHRERDAAAMMERAQELLIELWWRQSATERDMRRPRVS